MRTGGLLCRFPSGLSSIINNDEHGHHSKGWGKGGEKHHVD